MRLSEQKRMRRVGPVGRCDVPSMSANCRDVGVKVISLSDGWIGSLLVVRGEEVVGGEECAWCMILWLLVEWRTSGHHLSESGCVGR